MAMASASTAVSQSSCRAQAVGFHICGTSSPTTSNDGKRGIRSHHIQLPAIAAEKGAAAVDGCRRFLGASSSSPSSSFSSSSSSSSSSFSSKDSLHPSNCLSSSSCPSSFLKQQGHHLRGHPCHEQQRGALFGHCAPLRTSTKAPAKGGRGGGGPRFTRDLGSVVVAMAVSSPSSPSTEEMPSLSSLALTPFISDGGEVVPPPEDPSTKASVFAVYDGGKKVQYVGFSKDARNSLRTLLCRRPDLCYFYQVLNLPSLDQTQMLAIRSKWFSEIGNPPLGNEQATERAKWEKPFDAGSEERARERIEHVVKMLEERGLREKMEFNPSLLQEGKCDVLASAESAKASAEQMAAAAAAVAADTRRKHVAIPGPDGDIVEFDVFYQRKFPTNGGWMYDLRITANKLETTHRVIIGKVYPESVGISEDEFLERTFAYLLAKKLPRRTEGMLTSGQFPINYFSVSEVEQWYDDFKLMFADGEALLPGEAGYWRFNRVHNYGPSEDSMFLVGPQN